MYKQIDEKGKIKNKWQQYGVESVERGGQEGANTYLCHSRSQPHLIDQIVHHRLPASR